MVKKPILLAIIIVLFIASIGYILLYTNIFEKQIAPLQATVTKVLATRTGYAYATATQYVEYHQMTATAQQATRYEQQTQTQVSWNITATAIPTPTPTRGPSCLARVSEKFAFLYSDPGINPNENVVTSLPFQEEVQIVGIIRDKEAWGQIEFAGNRGFTQLSNLDKDDEGCSPQLLDLHYMANYLDDPDWRLFLEDTFSSNSHLWYAIDGEQINAADPSASEAILEVTSFGALTEFSTDNIKSKEFEAFELIFNAHVIRANTRGYLGVKFFQTEEGYNELRLNPYLCTFSVYDGDAELFTGNFDQSLCFKKDDFQVRIKVDELKRLNITLNGETQGPTRIVNINKRELSGPISLIVNDLQVTYNYLVVTAPKE